MPRVAIIGAGQSGLQLALGLLGPGLSVDGELLQLSALTSDTGDARVWTDRASKS